MRLFEKNEVLVVGVIIVVDKRITLPDRFKSIFKGETTVERGQYQFFYPIKNPWYSRMVNLLKVRYGLKVKYGVAGTMEV